MTTGTVIKPIKTEADYDAALKAIEHLWTAEAGRQQPTALKC